MPRAAQRKGGVVWRAQRKLALQIGCGRKMFNKA